MTASSSVMSARSKCVTCGISVADSVMRSAIVRRRCDSGCRSTGPHCSNFGSGGGSTPTRARGLATAGAAGRADVGAGSVEGVAGAGPAAARTSSSVTRPPGPLPRTAFRSTPSSRASRRVDGVAGTGPSRRAGASAAGACLARPSAITVFGSGAGVRVGSSVSAACLPPGAPASPNSTSTWPTFTVCPG